MGRGEGGGRRKGTCVRGSVPGPHTLPAMKMVGRHGQI